LENQMKKSLVFLAALAAVGGAFAQSNVTIYGVTDVAMGQFKTGVGAAELTATKLETAGLSTSRWGMKGSEDLGGGLKADFKLEGGMLMDTGAMKTNNFLFDRVATIGFSGSFGAVTLGRQTLPYDDLRGDVNNTFDSKLLTATKFVWEKNADVAGYTDRFDNSIVFKSAKYSGFSGSLGLSLGENKLATVDATHAVSLQARYEAGPLLVAFGHQNEQAQNSAKTATGSTTNTLIAGTYDFGVVKLVAGYNTTKRDAIVGVTEAGDKQYQFGLEVPLSAAAKVAVGYSNTKGDIINSLGGKKASGFSIIGQYDLSKRTSLYGGWMDAKAENAAGVETGKNTNIAAGVRHKF
jgi:predicted porin